jgi:hypothetical protein
MNFLALSLPEGARGGIIIFGALLAVVLVIFIWAVGFRKKPRQRKYRHRHADKAAPLATTQNGNGDAHRKRRRPRSGRRRLNPTLAQTRGLPPIRNRDTTPQGL